MPLLISKYTHLLWKKTHEIIFVNEFLRDDTDLDLAVFRAVKGCSEVEVGKIHGHELCIWF